MPRIAKVYDVNVSGVRDCIVAARLVYQLIGKQDQLQAFYPETSHDIPVQAQKVAYAFLEKNLK